jgi:hypothetical protein
MDGQNDERAQQQAQVERRIRAMILGSAALGVLLLLAVCATFASVAPYVAGWNAEPTRIEIQITGTVQRIAGMPLPADAQVISQTTRQNGGTFDFVTAHRPQQLYNFYYYLVAQRGRWLAGSRPQVEGDSAQFRFYPGVLPRLTIVTVRCDPAQCAVHVDY